VTMGSRPLEGANIKIFDTTEGVAPTDIEFGPTNSGGIAEIYIPLPDHRIENKAIKIWAEWNGDYYCSDPVTLYSKQRREDGSKSVTMNAEKVESYNDAILEYWITRNNIDLPDPSHKGVGVLYSLLSFLAYYHHFHAEYSPKIDDILKVQGFEYTNFKGDKIWQLTHGIRRNSHSIYDCTWWFNNEWDFIYETSPKILDPTGIVTTVASPVVVNVIAPDGTDSGYNPSTKELNINFPMAISNPGDEPFMVVIPQPEEGEYTFQLIGTDSGQYGVTIDKFDFKGDFINDLETQQNIENEEVHSYSLRYTYPDAFIHLYPGWNFISFPKDLSDWNNNVTIFSAVEMDGRQIWHYNTSTGNWDYLNEYEFFQPMDAHWVYSQRDIELPLDFAFGRIMPPEKQLYPGWNAIGPGSLSPMPANLALYPVRDSWTFLLPYDNGLQMYMPPVVNGQNSGEVVPFKGYWIYMQEEEELVGFG